MRGGILIIGSLLWDSRPERAAWRKSRLATENAVPVNVPIHYGRRSESRGDTFTMTLASGGTLGQGILVPCRKEFADVAALASEAEELWKAEQPTAAPHSIAASWGCVGLLFRNQFASVKWRIAWAAQFRRSVSSPVHPVTKCGLLGIKWPEIAVDSTAADVEVLLATATKADPTRPSPEDVADAWINQRNGHESYFFENVRCGIRTPEDALIWRRMEAGRPGWLQGGAYPSAVAILRGENQSRV